MIRKPCAQPGCTQLVPIGVERCPTHTALQQQSRNHDRAQRGLHAREWRQLRTRVLERDHHQCQLRLDGCTRHATQAHIRPELQGNHNQLTDDDAIAACAHCNASESNTRRARTPGGRAILGNARSPGTGVFQPDSAGDELVFG